jgi:hypothetical protein
MDKDSKEFVIFTEALRLPPAERADYLARACAGEDDLRAKVEALLKAHNRVGDFLEHPSDGLTEGGNGSTSELPE